MGNECFMITITASSLLINGLQLQRFYMGFYLRYRHGLNTVEQRLTCATKILKKLKKLGRDRRTVASSITVNEEIVDLIEETQENTKCDFEIEE